MRDMVRDEALLNLKGVLNKVEDLYVTVEKLDSELQDVRDFDSEYVYRVKSEIFSMGNYLRNLVNEAVYPAVREIESDLK